MLSRRHFFLGSLAATGLAARKPVERPSVLLLTVDNLPSWLLGCYGNKEVRTPNIDRLSRMGVRFERHTVCSPAPVPGLATMLSGLTPMQLAGGESIPPSAATLDKLLAGAGYATQTADPASAITFLGGQNAAKPFFLRVHFTSLQPPYSNVPQKYLDLYATATLDSFGREPASPHAALGKEMLANRLANQRKAAAAVTALDDQLQKVYAQLAARGLTEKTLVILTSTCGALLGRHGLWDAGEASTPVNMYRESVETPLIWVWLGQTPAQITRPEVVNSYDLLPSLCDSLSITPPSGNLCGRSYLPLATGKPLPKKQPWPTTTFGRLHETAMARIERYKVVVRDAGKGEGELYDLRTDPGEAVNQYENPQFLTVRQQLTADLAGWERRYSS